VHGTLLGVAAIAVLGNGLSRVPATMSSAGELSGLLTGVLLVLALASGAVPKWFIDRRSRKIPAPVPP
jgi:hypothetical protein